MGEMVRHLGTVHLPLYIGAASVLVSTSRALLRQARRSAIGNAMTVAFAGAVLPPQRPGTRTLISAWTRTALPLRGHCPSSDSSWSSSRWRCPADAGDVAPWMRPTNVTPHDPWYAQTSRSAYDDHQLDQREAALIAEPHPASWRRPHRASPLGHHVPVAAICALRASVTAPAP